MSTTHTMTAEALLKLPRGRGRYELVRGELKTTSPAGSEHGAVVVRVTSPLDRHARETKLGIVFGAETGFQIESDPDTVRAPDVAFVRRERIPEGGLPKAFWPGAPDLA